MTQGLDREKYVNCINVFVLLHTIVIVDLLLCCVFRVKEGVLELFFSLLSFEIYLDFFGPIEGFFIDLSDLIQKNKQNFYGSSLKNANLSAKIQQN